MRVDLPLSQLAAMTRDFNEALALNESLRVKLATLADAAEVTLTLITPATVRALKHAIAAARHDTRTPQLRSSGA